MVVMGGLVLIIIPLHLVVLRDLLVHSLARLGRRFLPIGVLLRSRVCYRSEVSESLQIEDGVQATASGSRIRFTGA